jgi:hypothetical protein
MHFDHDSGQFRSLAFKPSAGGISVIDEGCVSNSGSPICSHIRRFYPANISGEPPVFWRLPKEAYSAEGTRLEQETTPSGDHCHFNLFGLTTGRARQIIKAAPLAEFSICAPEGVRPLDADDLVD